MAGYTPRPTMAELDARVRALEQRLVQAEIDRHTTHARIRALEAVLGGMLRNATPAVQLEAVERALDTLQRVGGPPVAIERQDEVIDLADSLVPWICTGRPP